mmetsp:Transcript_46616/g.113515  ORF Transcript_46616/g.113515 Transcript_46616/m.113515 type:complete len:307 (-) Transcript_46616:55-975(-)
MAEERGRGGSARGFDNQLPTINLKLYESASRRKKQEGATQKLTNVRVPKLEYDIKEIEVAKQIEVPVTVTEEYIVPREVEREVTETIMVPQQVTKKIRETVMVPEQRSKTIKETKTVLEKQTVRVPKPVMHQKTYYVQQPKIVMESVPVTVNEPAYEERQLWLTDDEIRKAQNNQLQSSIDFHNHIQKRGSTRGGDSVRSTSTRGSNRPQLPQPTRTHAPPVEVRPTHGDGDSWSTSNNAYGSGKSHNRMISHEHATYTNPKQPAKREYKYYDNGTGQYNDSIKPRRAGGTPNSHGQTKRDHLYGP